LAASPVDEWVAVACARLVCSLLRYYLKPAQFASMLLRCHVTRTEPCRRSGEERTTFARSEPFAFWPEPDIRRRNAIRPLTTPKATIAWRVKRHAIHVRRRLDDAVSANLCHVVLDVSVARSGLSAEW